ncbi:MAG: zf-HC2 domain-containing protein [Candidatus Sulfopaludibacter sp.]|nr:zf-HC2 domain-containing protein [Candidatus Sulfopaludibacter sp.]
MNCTHWEERIALYAGGDLPAAEAAEVERHLGDCPGCQLFASGLKESLQLLQGIHQDPIALAHFAAVRARVMAELEGSLQPWWRKAWMYGLAVAVAAALFLMLALRPAAPVHPKRMAVQVLLPQVDVAPPEPVVPRVIKAHGVRRPRVRPPAVVPRAPGPPIVVKLLTDDPDVVIYWITDNSGE